MAIIFNFKIVTLLILALNMSNALGQLYLGGGGAFMRSSYRTSKSESSTNTSLLKEYTLLSRAASSKFSFNGTQADLIDKIYNTFPEKSSDIKFFIRFSSGKFGTVCEIDDSIKDPSFYPYDSKLGCIPVNPASEHPSKFDLQTGDSKKAIALIETDFGRAFGEYFIKYLKPDLTINFAPNSTQKIEFYSILGKKIMAAFMGSDTYTRSQILNKLSNSPLFDASQLTLELGKLTEEELRDQFNLFQKAFSDTLNSMEFAFGNDGTLTPAQSFEMAGIKKSVSSNDVQISLLAGIGNIREKTYFGIELLLDLGPQKTGKNTKNEIKLSSFYTLGIIGKVGYSFQKRSFNYINLGLAMKEYKTQYEGFALSFSNNSFATNLFAGIGMEFLLNKSTGIFTEINYIVSTSSIKTGAPNGKTLNASSTQIKLGAKYYFGNHPLSNDIFASEAITKSKQTKISKNITPSTATAYAPQIHIRKPTDLKPGPEVSANHIYPPSHKKLLPKTQKKKPFVKVAKPYPTTQEPYDIEYETKIIIRGKGEIEKPATSPKISVKENGELNNKAVELHSSPQDK